ncbi:hypothetical protein [Roseiconus lacunae]|uniref:hypothetical protein n=1 Tax=Roseiconus lacunae TaxID=2605694 RepID=UPI001E2BDAA5|nr:hypothetical protein [Roseiconus lacunae]MCD0459548.1 hypothetical protein [Roseiconus lacunae]
MDATSVDIAYAVGKFRNAVPMTKSIKCTVAENALDYLLLAGEQAQDGSERLLKHALATLADGIELLLKARLEAHDWSLLFKDVDKAERAKFESGDFQSVTFDQSLKRLKNICGVDFDHSGFPILESLRQLRNRIRHFAVEVKSAQAQSIIANAYSFAIDFVATEITPNTTDDLEYEVNDLRKTLSTFKEFVAQRMKDIEAKLKSQTYSQHVQCPACLQDTLYAEGEKVTCAFCNFEADGESAAYAWADQNYPQSLKDSLIEPVVEECPECASMACVPAGHMKGASYTHVCLSCGETGDFQHCLRCNSLCPTDNVGDMCDSCREHIISGWD